MQYGFVFSGGTAPEQLELAVLAEESGWDGVFVYESAAGVDAWSLLAAMAVRTERVRLGTMLTPLPFRRPWKVASQVATVDQLSGGRAILAVGLGATDFEIGVTGEEEDLRLRAAQLDEGLDLVTGIWTGGHTFHGEHYDLDLSGRSDLATTGVCVQQPHVPVWCVGLWPRPKSMARAARVQGIVPQGVESPDQYAEMVAWLRDHGAAEGYSCVIEGSSAEEGAAAVRPWADAGATWWLEAAWDLTDAAALRARIRSGPPT